MGERRAQELRAHWEDPHRSARHEHRLCRVPGAAVGSGGGSGALQDDRRRQDLEADPQDQRRHGSDGRRPRSAQPRHPPGGLVPAPPSRLGAHQRRARIRDLQVHGRRRHLEEARERPPQGGDGADRTGVRAGQPRRDLRADRVGQQGRRVLPVHRSGWQLGEGGGLLLRERPVLPGDHSRPEGRRPRLLDGHLDDGQRTAGRHSTRSARSTSTWTTTRSGSIRTTPTT